MNFAQLLQVAGITALVTLGLVLLLLRLWTALRGGLRRRLPPPLPETAGRTPPRCMPGTPE
ncbi:cellulose biosynthesis protein BcsF [Pseudomonas monteilii]|uniref:cellulose biosynthesis protein BcsF n=1 Tax=Pseudomonas monteilii TaxID=76759 RepID=UPI0021DAC21D|nr:cellulose biosynthesis protein BcsF [Pseudomonas monteilii]